MSLRRLSVNGEDDDQNSASIWIDDDLPGEVIVVDRLLDPSPVPVGSDKVTIRMPLRLIRDAGIG